MSEKHWLVIGHYGGHNTGDEAMLLGLVAGCDPNLRKRLTIVTADGNLPPVVSALGVKAISAKPKVILSHLFSSQGIILGGGSHFQDDYLGWRYLRHFRYMSRIVVLSILSFLFGKKVLWISMGFGPFLRFPTKILTRIGLRMCHSVTVRESESAENIKKWLASNKCKITFDLAALIPFQEVTDATNKIKNLQQITLGVSAISVANLESGGSAVDQLFWQRFTSALSMHLKENQRLHIRIITIRGGNREDDRMVSSEMYDLLSEIDSSRVELVPYQENALAMFKEIAVCDAFVASRFHSGVLAYLAGCRLFFIEYHKKVLDLAHEIGLPDQAHIPLRESVAAEQIYAGLDELINNIAQNRPQLPIHQAVLRAKKNIEIIRAHS